jgi:hypothetical protein
LRLLAATNPIYQELIHMPTTMVFDDKPHPDGFNPVQVPSSQKESSDVANLPKIAAVTKVCDNHGLRSICLAHPAVCRAGFGL